MLLVATIFALLIGAAVEARPGRNDPRSRVDAVSARHQAELNPILQGRSSLTQGFLCDWCVVGVEDAQAAVQENLNEIYGVLNRTAQLCQFCPVPDECVAYFETEIPLAIDDFLAENPTDLCNEAGLCDENATLPGLVMSNLNGNIARDRVIKQMLMRARVMQQKMIRLILGPDYMCTACQDFMTISREMLLDNETQYEVMEFLAPMCDYLPTEYQADCTEFVQSLPELMTLLANEVLIDSTCTELGLCKQAEETPLPDIFSQLGLDRIVPGLFGGQNRGPFQNPFGSSHRPEQNPSGHYPYGNPNRPQYPRPGQNPYGFPSQTRPGQNPFESHPRPRPQSPISKWPNYNSRPVRPQKPNTTPKPTPKPKDELIPDLNLEDIFGRVGQATGVLDRLPSLPEIEMPRLPINIPGGRNYGNYEQSRRNQGRRRHGQRRQRSLTDLVDIDLPSLTDIGKSAGTEIKEHVYIPDPIPDGGITISEKNVNEDCEACKLGVTAFDAWLQDNAPEIQKMVSNLVQPFCQLFPSPMKEDCVSDAAELVQTLIQRVVSNLQPEPVCTWFGLCSAEEGELLPTMDTGMEPTTWPFMP